MKIRAIIKVTFEQKWMEGGYIMSAARQQNVKDGV